MPALLTATVLVVVAACARAGPEPTARHDAAAAPTSVAEPAARSRVPSPAGPFRPSPHPPPDGPAQPEPRRAFLSIPALGLRGVPVDRYRGAPDDRRGTALQDGGVMASPRGPGGGVGPGVVGNFIVTGHRTAHGAPLRDLPELEVGARVLVRSGAQEFVYRITGTRWTSFRSPASLVRQSARVPGRPGAVAVRPMLTLSTCATPEDHAAGNFWSDEHGNPDHRIDKVGVLEGVRAAG